MKIIIISLLCVCCLTIYVQSSFALIIEWTGNGHYYELMSGEHNMFSWDEAREKANERGGYLVTITSQEEQTWIIDNFSVGRESIWVGGYQDFGGPEEIWKWVTGEPCKTSIIFSGQRQLFLPDFTP